MPFNRKLLAKIEYKGTNYHGWQRQPNAITVEEIIQKVLSKIYQCQVKMKVCSRTDAGVHARGQLATIKVPFEKPLYQIQDSLNSLLPSDIAIIDLVYVHEDYIIRNESSGKQYIYRVNNSKIPKAIENDFFWWVKSDLSVLDMEKAAVDFIGRHNYKAYQGKGCTQKGSEKEIFDFQIHSKNSYNHHEVDFIISGSGFFRNMIRIMVGTLIQIGRGRLGVDVVKRTLASGKREEAGLTAPPQGLTLNEIYLKNDPFN